MKGQKMTISVLFVDYFVHDFRILVEPSVLTMTMAPNRAGCGILSTRRPGMLEVNNHWSLASQHAWVASLRSEDAMHNC